MHDDAPRIDDMYDALTHPTRREALRYLSNCDAPTTVASLAGGLHDRLSATDGEDAGEQDLRVALVHVHLPKLAEAGLVDWNGDHAVLSSGVKGLRVSPPVVDGRFDFTITHRETMS